MPKLPIQRIAFLGFGEAGAILASRLAAAGVEVSMFDARMAEERSRELMLKRAQESRVRASESVESAIREVDLVISAVTASAAVGVAKNAAAHLQRGQIYLDINSVSPDTKVSIFREIEPSRADFVEGAVTAPVPPQQLKVPILLGGTRAAELSHKLNEVGMNTTAVSERIGVASAIKMCRSVVMKGLAALAIEALFAARTFGAEDAVLASLDATYPNMGWRDSLPENLIGRTAEHSRRRSAEMREVQQTLRGSGTNPFMASSTVEVLNWLTEEMESRNIVVRSGEAFSWRALADAIEKPDQVKVD